MITYKVGDQVRVICYQVHWKNYPPSGTIVTVTEVLAGERIACVVNSVRIEYNFDCIEPYEEQKPENKVCTCPIHVLVNQGCQCGGA